MRIRTGNHRRRSKIIKQKPFSILKVWTAFVDDVDKHKVYLQLVEDYPDNSDERIYGTFPKRLFGNIDVKLGLYLRIEVTSHGKIYISTIESTQEEIDEAKKRVDELISLVRKCWETQYKQGTDNEISN